MKRFLISLSLLIAFTTPEAVAAVAAEDLLPATASIITGSVTFSAPKHIVVTQTTSNAIIDCENFSLEQGSSIRFLQPDTDSITLIRVTGSVPSVLRGLLKATGHVWLINPYGITIEDDAKVDADFVGTTRGITNENFVAQRYIFEGIGQTPITLGGKIELAPDKWARLAGAHITCMADLLLTAPSAKLMLAGTEGFSLDMGASGIEGLRVDPTVATTKVSIHMAKEAVINAINGRVCLCTQEAPLGIIEVCGRIKAGLLSYDPGTIHIVAAPGAGSDSASHSAHEPLALPTAMCGGTVMVMSDTWVDTRDLHRELGLGASGIAHEGSAGAGVISDHTVAQQASVATSASLSLTATAAVAGSPPKKGGAIYLIKSALPIPAITFTDFGGGCPTSMATPSSSSAAAPVSSAAAPAAAPTSDAKEAEEGKPA